MEDLAQRELRALGASSLAQASDGLRLTHDDPYGLCREVRTVSALYRELRFAVPRPKALLGDEAVRRLVAVVKEVATSAGLGSFRFAAAGSSSAVFQRLAASLSGATGLRHDPVEGAMLLRVRPYRPPSGGAALGASAEPATGWHGHSGGWEVLVRLTGRPLSTRDWRVCNRPGGINATVAVAMNELLGHARGAYLNLMCGSGTLLAERAASGPVRRLVGVDIEQGAIDCARVNLEAAGVTDFELYRGDVTARLPGGSGPAAAPPGDWPQAVGGGFEELSSDAPWGDAVGDHAANARLYPQLLSTAARLAAPGARFALLSHEVRLLERLLPQRTDWQVGSSRRLSHGGHRPLLVLLKRV